MYDDSLHLSNPTDLTAAPTPLDHALQPHAHAHTHAGPPPLPPQHGRAPPGLETRVFAWRTFEYTTAERDVREEKKGELHGGVLWRMNREVGRERGGGKVEGDGNAKGVPLCAGRRGEGMSGEGGGVRVGMGIGMAKGVAKEVEKELFWEGEIKTGGERKG